MKTLQPAGLDPIIARRRQAFDAVGEARRIISNPLNYPPFCKGTRRKECQDKIENAHQFLQSLRSFIDEWITTPPRRRGPPNADNRPMLDLMGDVAQGKTVREATRQIPNQEYLLEERAHSNETLVARFCKRVYDALLDACPNQVQDGILNPRFVSDGQLRMVFEDWQGVRFSRDPREPENLFDLPAFRCAAERHYCSLIKKSHRNR